MRLKTFLATYFLFLLILFSTIVTVSVYMTNNQMTLLRDKSAREFQTITTSLSRDIAGLYSRSASTVGFDFFEAVDNLMRGYIRHYRQYGIEISLTNLSLTDEPTDMPSYADITFLQQGQSHFVHVTGVLPMPLNFFRLDYFYNITEQVAAMQSIQRMLLLFSVLFSIVAAAGLYLIILRVFRPIGVVAAISRQIADGHYSERIRIHGKNELSSMALDFNRMAQQIEKQIQCLETEAIGKQQFIDNFAHEMRTPLTAIFGYAEYMLKAPLDIHETADSAQQIMDKANHMKKMADSLLALATLRNYTPTKNIIHIRPLFDDIAQTLRSSLREKKVRLFCKNDTDILVGQDDLIKCLLLNMCANAIKACAPISGIIYLDATQCEENVILSVTDNGCGIADDEITHITEPFYRVDKARSQSGGAGLGLTLCKQITEVHGAEISIKSSLGYGTKISVRFTIP